jgi:hypothetical protein
MLDHLRLDPFGRRLLRPVIAGMALVHERDLNGTTGNFLDLLRRFGHLGTFLLVRRSDYR